MRPSDVFSLRRASLLAVVALSAGCGAFSGSAAGLDGQGGVGAQTPAPNTPDTGADDGVPASTLPATTPNGTVDDPNADTGTTGSSPNATPITRPAPTNKAAFAFGAIIDFDGLGPHGKQSALDFVKNTGVTPAVIDSYVQLKSDNSFELSLAKTIVDQAVAAKVPTVCLSVTCQVQGALGDTQVNQLVSAVTYGIGRGVNMEVRFGYEMNGDWSPSNKVNGVSYVPSKFLAQWAQLAPKVQAAGGKMFWSPNIPFNAGSALARWLPADSNTIDIVGIDYYPKSQPTTAASVQSAIDTIYPIAKQLNKPMLFGESAWQNTGSSIQENASEAATKVAWLKALTDADLRAKYPLYGGFRWIDYQKYENNTYNNFSISADPYAAKAFRAWYATSVFATP